MDFEGGAKYLWFENLSQHMMMAKATGDIALESEKIEYFKLEKK